MAISSKRVNQKGRGRSNWLTYGCKYRTIVNLVPVLGSFLVFIVIPGFVLVCDGEQKHEFFVDVSLRVVIIQRSLFAS